MVITYQGGESFKLTQGELAVTMNPRSKSAADITLFSTGRGETADKSGFVIEGPGEYEVKGVTVKGFLSQEPSGELVTIYLLSFEGMNLCFLGPAAGELPGETQSELEDIDILFAPVSDYKLAVALEPKIIIPTGYTPDTLKKFLKEAGVESAKPEEKLVVKKKDLEGKEGEIIILKETA